VRFVLRLPSLEQLRRDGMLSALLISIGLHVGLVAAAVAARTWRGEQDLPLPVYTVDLVELPVAAPAPAGGDAGKPAPAPQPPEPEPEPEPSEVEAVPEVPPEKKPPPKPKPKPKPEPEKKPEPKAPPKPKPQTTTQPRRQAVAPETTTPAGTPDTGEGPSDSPGSGLAPTGGQIDGVPTIDSDAFSFGYYRAILTNRLRSTWSRPLVPGGLQQPIRATVQFVVLRSGAITEVSLVESSTYSPLDRSALRAVFDANPLPPLPDPYEEDRLAVTFFFELTPER
jgi:TonB family protein